MNSKVFLNIPFDFIITSEKKILKKQLLLLAMALQVPALLPNLNIWSMLMSMQCSPKNAEKSTQSLSKIFPEMFI